jgi:hypothetical protein
MSFPEDTFPHPLFTDLNLYEWPAVTVLMPGIASLTLRPEISLPEDHP